MTDGRTVPLHRFADFLRRERTRLTERWMKAVCGDSGVVEADKLTYEQLADHLPNIFDELCDALDAEEFERAEPGIERQARQHGVVRWRQGYRIQEVVRELDLFHETLADALEAFADTDSTFTRRHERRARRLIAEALSFVASTSVREAVAERDRKLDEYTGKLERVNEELTRRQRLVSELFESRMQITRSVVHDLRSFLNAFSVALQLIERAPENAEKALKLANRQAADMKQLVDQMLAYSVILGNDNPLAVEQFKLRDLFEELVATYRPAIEEKGLCLRTHFDAKLSSATVTSNRLKVKEVAVNLLSNATKYTTSGEVELAFAMPEPLHWSIRVSDTGAGIALSDADRVFEEFERAAGEGIPGAGLGLAIVKELCRFLHGKIRFVSNKGDGTTFEIRFPIALEHADK